MLKSISYKVLSPSLLFTLVFSNFNAQAAPQYAFTDLGTLAGNTSSIANAINNNGQIVGSSGTNAIVWNSLGNQFSILSLGTGRANGINDLGQIVGGSTQ